MRRALSIAPAAIVAAAGVAFLFYQWSGARPFWVDEEMIAINIRDRSLTGLTGPLWLGQSAPLGWLVVQRLMLMAAGAAEQTLRLVPVLFGAATLAASVWIGHRWMTAVGAFVLALLCTFGLWISHFPLELKHYSADAFFGLMLPALAASALGSGDAGRVRRRAMIWWVVAVCAHWLSNGGLMAAPGCALLLFAAIWRRHGAREAAIFALAGTVWLLSFAMYYELSLRHTHNNPYLRGQWSAEVMPAGAGAAEALTWIASRLEPLARHPGGTAQWMALWLGALAGLALGRARTLAAMFATLPVAAFALAAIGLVPLYERFSLWMLPALYVGIALLADRAALLLGAGLRGRRAALLPAAALAAAVILVSVDVVARGAAESRHRRLTDANHGHHDRDSIAWLLAQRKPGDALLTTRLGWPAVWWYGNMRPQHDTDLRAGEFQVEYRSPGSDCRPGELRDALQPYARALVHFGFPDMPDGADHLLLRQLDELGAIAYYREFGDAGFAAIIDLHTPNPEESTLELVPRSQIEHRRLAGCIDVTPPRLW